MKRKNKISLTISITILGVLFLLHLHGYLAPHLRGPIQDRYDFSRVRCVTVYNLPASGSSPENITENVAYTEMNMDLFEEAATNAHLYWPFLYFITYSSSVGYIAKVDFENNGELYLQLYSHTGFRVCGESGRYFFQSDNQLHAQRLRKQWRDELSRIRSIFKTSQGRIVSENKHDRE